MIVNEERMNDCFRRANTRLIALLALLAACNQAWADTKTVQLAEHSMGQDTCTETLAKEGDFVYVARRHDGVAIVDVSTPNSPVTIATIDPDGPNASTVDVWDVQVLDGTLYIFNEGEAIDPNKGNWTGVYIYDVSFPWLPVELGAIVWGSQPWHHLAGQSRSGEVGKINGVPHIFVCSEITGEVEVFDVSNPANAVWKSTVFSPTWDSPFETVFQNNKLYTAWGGGGFTIDDVANPALPVRDQWQPYTGPGTINGGLKTIAPTPDGLHVVTGEYTQSGHVRLWDVANGISQVATWQLGTGALIWSVRATNDYAYVAHLEDGIQILDIANRNSLTPAGCFEPDAAPATGVWRGIPDLVIDGMTLYASHDSRGLFVVEHDPQLAPPDTITITKADWKRRQERLIVYATSSNQPSPTLTVQGFGVMTWKANRNRYQLVLRNVSSNPGTVTVRSSDGGSATRTVRVR